MIESKGIREEFEGALNYSWFSNEKLCQEEMDDMASIALWAARWVAERCADYVRCGSCAKELREYTKELGDSQ